MSLKTMSLKEAFGQSTGAKLFAAGAMILTGLAMYNALKGREILTLVDGAGVAIMSGTSLLLTKIKAREANNDQPKQP